MKSSLAKNDNAILFFWNLVFLLCIPSDIKLELGCLDRVFTKLKLIESMFFFFFYILEGLFYSKSR